MNFCNVFDAASITSPSRCCQIASRWKGEAGHRKHHTASIQGRQKPAKHTKRSKYIKMIRNLQTKRLQGFQVPCGNDWGKSWNVEGSRSRVCWDVDSLLIHRFQLVAIHLKKWLTSGQLVEDDAHEPHVILRCTYLLSQDFSTNGRIMANIQSNHGHSLDSCLVPTVTVGVWFRSCCWNNLLTSCRKGQNTSITIRNKQTPFESPCRHQPTEVAQELLVLFWWRTGHCQTRSI